MEHQCPHCGGVLPEDAAFCPHCARDIHTRRSVQIPVRRWLRPLRRAVVLAVLAAVGTGLWLAFGPKAYDGYGEVRYGDYQVLLALNADSYAPAPEVTIQGEPEGQYRVPSRLFVNDIHTGEDASEAFLAQMKTVTAQFIGQEDSPSPFVCSQPAYNPGAPECPLLSLIDFAGSGGIGLAGSAPFRATNCTFTGWDTGVLAYGTSWANVIGCTFRENGIGFRFDSTGEYANHSLYNDNLFEDNDTAVRLDNVPTDAALNFVGSVFRDNGQDIVNSCQQPLDTSQAIFE